MAEKPKDEKGKIHPKDKKLSKEDLEKTVLDVDVRGMDRVLEETMIFERPPLDEEDTDLHGRKALAEKKEAEKPSEEAPELPQEKVSKAPPPSVSEKAPKKEKPSPATEEPFATAPVGPVWKAIEFLIGLFLLLVLLDASIEALAAASPVSRLTVGISIACLLINVIFILKKGNFQAGVQASALALIGLLFYSTFQYGSADPDVFTVLKHPPAELFNFVFLAVYLFILGMLLAERSLSILFRGILVLLTVYGSLGIVENLIRGVSAARIWNFEDSLFGSPWWKWMPWYTLRPTLFSLWGMLPLLLVCFLLFKVSAFGKRKKALFRQNFFAFVLILFTLGLGHLLLFQNRLTSFFGFFLTPSLGMGETQAFSQNSDAGLDVEVATSNAPTERINDLARRYKMAALFSSTGEGKKTLAVSVRGEGGRAIPFLTGKELNVLQEEVVQKPIKVVFKEAELIRPRSLAVLVDRSYGMSPVLSFILGGVKDLFDLTNSKENFYLVSFGDDVKSVLIHNKVQLKKQVGTLSAQGNRNLAGAFGAALSALQKMPGDKILFLVTGADAVLPEDLVSKVAGQLKSAKVKPYVVAVGESALAPSLQTLGEMGGGRVFSVKNAANVPLALRAGFADAFGEYQISYEGQSFSPKLKIASPAPNTEIFQETPLILQILNAPSVKLKLARLYIDGRPLQEIPAQGQAEIRFGILPGQMPRGSHVFRAAVITEEGKEYSQEIKLSLSEAMEFRFIRPLEGDVVSGQVNLEVYFKSHDQNPLARVDYFLDGQKIGEVSSEPYLFTWDAQGQTGTHTIQAVGNFADGGTKTDQIKVNIMPGFSIRIVSPSVGEFLSNLSEIEADVTHTLSEIVSKVEFFADGEPLGDVNQPPYKYLWDNSDLSSGKHVLQARVTSASNYTATDAVIVNIGTGSLSVQLADSVGAPPGAGGFFAPDAVEWLVDASISMNGTLHGVKKIDLARQAIQTMLSRVPPTTQMAFRVYGSQTAANHQDCKDSLLLTPLKSVDAAKIGQALSQIEAHGLSPLGYALEKVRGDLKTGAGSRVVILITDGFDNCGGDPVGQLEKWKKEKLNAKLYVVGLDVEGTRPEIELKRLASLAGGQYYAVHDQKELVDALEEMVKVTYRILNYKGREMAQRPIGAPSMVLRTGEYRVEVDIEPPLVKEKVLINNGVERRLILKKEGNSFSLEEK